MPPNSRNLMIPEEEIEQTLRMAQDTLTRARNLMKGPQSLFFMPIEVEGMRLLLGAIRGIIRQIDDLIDAKTQGGA